MPEALLAESLMHSWQRLQGVLEVVKLAQHLSRLKGSCNHARSAGCLPDVTVLDTCKVFCMHTRYAGRTAWCALYPAACWERTRPAGEETMCWMHARRPESLLDACTRHLPGVRNVVQVAESV